MWLYKDTGPPPKIPEAWDAGKWNAGAQHVSALRRRSTLRLPG